ncbi:inositol monophosphatase family protein [Pseudomonas abietaniphila]|uniref:inositol monophosphatase family protein n=1 Tax=Pseudomonas abietaniphila TaxID=89065 RepID=UPI0007867F80|nr:inositol monophosphatase family protein [Pseudomonas abietaniphila]
MNIENLKHELSFIIEMVKHAGKLLSSESMLTSGPRGFRDKAEIDVVIEECLREVLVGTYQFDWCGEETGHSLTGNPWCWVVDPNDGTSDFLRGLKGSAVSVGLLHELQPVLGVVYTPVLPSGSSDCISWAFGMDHLLRNESPIVVDLLDQRLSEESQVMVSAAAVDKPEINTELCAPGQFHAMTSIAYRLARVAAGDGVCAVSLYPVSAHDVVAGHALLQGAKGVLVGQDGAPIRYTTEGLKRPVSGRVFGGAPRACTDLARRDWRKVFE